MAGFEEPETIKSHVIAALPAKSLLAKHLGDTRAQAGEELGRLGVVDGPDGMELGMSAIFTKEHPDEIILPAYLPMCEVFWYRTVNENRGTI